MQLVNKCCTHRKRDICYYIFHIFLSNIIYSDKAVTFSITNCHQVVESFKAKLLNTFS